MLEYLHADHLCFDTSSRLGKPSEDSKMFLVLLYFALPLVGKLLVPDFGLYIAS